MPRASTRWEGRPRGALAIRVAAFLVPIAAAISAAALAGQLLPRPETALSTVLWWLAVVAVSTAVLVLVDRQARRLLPLAALLKLAMAFPDRAPSRLRVALQAGTVRNLEERLEQRKHGGVQDEPGQAAAAILVLAGALTRHDRRTRGHSERVRGFADLIAQEMHLSDEECDRLRWAALLHDIGKVEVHPEILNKDGTLSAEEWAAVRQHPLDGARIAAPLRPWLGEWVDAIEHHHERWDGQGYPHGLAGQDISLAARIVAVADAFEVMTNPRSYRRTVGATAARDELGRCAGTHFDPEVVRAFVNVSIGRLRWAMAPLAWLGELPVLRQVTRAGEVVGSGTAGAAVKTTAAMTLAFLGGTVGPPPEPPPSAEAEAPRMAQPPGPPQPPGSGGEQPALVATVPATPPPAETTTTVASAAQSTAASVARVRAAGKAPAPRPSGTSNPPVAADDTASVRPGRTVFIDVLANDRNPDPRTLQLVGEPREGDAEVKRRRVRYEADDDFRGVDEFRYRVCDVQGVCSVATVRVTVG